MCEIGQMGLKGWMHGRDTDINKTLCSCFALLFLYIETNIKKFGLVSLAYLDL